MRPARPLAVAMVASLIVAASCTDDDDSGPLPPVTDPPASTSPTTTAVEPPSPGDRLILGLLLPESDDNELGVSLREGAQLAVDEARAAGAEIRLVPVEEGATRAETTDAVNQLVDEEVDAVVGPSSSITALDSLDLLVAAGLPTCSPTASSLLLDDFPDDDLFMRTIPSDSLQALAIADLASDSGAGEVAIAYIDDHYGRGLNKATVGAIDARGDLDIVTQVPLPDDPDNLPGAVDELLDESPGAVVVLADGALGPRFLRALDRHIGEEATPLPPRAVIVNDAMRRPQPADAMAGLSAAFWDSVRGVAPWADPPITSDLRGPYSENAYNCVTALAFAWQVAAEQGRQLSIPLVSEITSSGQTCSTYQDCMQDFEENPTINIHYWGPGRRLELGADGDPLEAQFEVFRFDEDGNDFSDQNDAPVRVRR